MAETGEVQGPWKSRGLEKLKPLSLKPRARCSNDLDWAVRRLSQDGRGLPGAQGDAELHGRCGKLHYYIIYQCRHEIIGCRGVASIECTVGVWCVLQYGVVCHWMTPAKASHSVNAFCAPKYLALIPSCTIPSSQPTQISQYFLGLSRSGFSAFLTLSYASLISLRRLVFKLSPSA